MRGAGTIAIPRLLGMAMAAAVMVGALALPARLPQPSLPSAAPDAYVVNFTGQAVRHGNTYRVVVSGAHTFRAGLGFILPLGWVDATADGLVLDIDRDGLGTVATARVGLATGKVTGLGGTLYSLSHVEWVASAGVAVATGRIREKGGKYRVADTFVAMLRIEPIGTGLAGRVSAISGSVVVEAEQFSWLSSRPLTY